MSRHRPSHLHDGVVLIVEDRAQIQADDAVFMISMPAYKQAWDRPRDLLAPNAALIRQRFKQATA
ncbi:MAG TPA: hypothetical protein VFU22_00370 [Roseiflexaceae bacterium]|nr:hypothetical protein [Roseiflexaceae bacterium]